MSSLLPDYAKARLAFVSLVALLDRKPNINNWESDEGLRPDIDNNDQDFDWSIDFNSIGFSYPTRADAAVLRGLSLNMVSGKCVALVASSGCGKSTATQLVERFYDPDSGELLLNRVGLRLYNLHWLRSHIGIVSQEPVLFDATIAENIAYGDNSRQVSMDEIVEASKKANIYDFISKLPNVSFLNKTILFTILSPHSHTNNNKKGLRYECGLERHSAVGRTETTHCDRARSCP